MRIENKRISSEISNKSTNAIVIIIMIVITFLNVISVIIVISLINEYKRSSFRELFIYLLLFFWSSFVLDSQLSVLLYFFFSALFCFGALSSVLLHPHCSAISIQTLHCIGFVFDISFSRRLSTSLSLRCTSPQAIHFILNRYHLFNKCCCE